jgi:hypothetical protein
MTKHDLLAEWVAVADCLTWRLMKNGQESAVLVRLGGNSKASNVIVRETFGSTLYSDDFRYRKLAAALSGYTKEPDEDLLAFLFDQEHGRDISLRDDSIKRLECQSVVEDIVFAACRWARNERLRPRAMDFLERIVRLTVAGDYWNTASYAMTTLCRHNYDKSFPLLQMSAAFARTAEIRHPCRPDMRQERDFSSNLQARNPETLEAIERLLISQEDNASISLSSGDLSASDRLIRTAARFEESAG